MRKPNPASKTARARGAKSPSPTLPLAAEGLSETASKSTPGGVSQAAPDNAPSKQPFNIDVAIERIDEAVKPFAKAALFELAEAGYNSTFEQLVACIISIRTYDEVMLPTARRLFEVARIPEAMSRLTPEQIDDLIRAATFHEPKARQIHEIANRVVSEYGGVLPCDAEVLLSFRGVGPKCANLVLGIACNQPFIGVDIHVHRVTNRWKPFGCKIFDFLSAISSIISVFAVISPIWKNPRFLNSFSA